MKEVEAGSTDLDGEWLVYYFGDPDAIEQMIPTDKRLRFIFEGGSYEIIDDDGEIETFVFCDGRQYSATGNHDNLFIFSRSGKTPKIAAYLFETSLGDPTSADWEYDRILLYNWLAAPLNIDSTGSDQWELRRDRP